MLSFGVGPMRAMRIDQINFERITTMKYFSIMLLFFVTQTAFGGGIDNCQSERRMIDLIRHSKDIYEQKELLDTNTFTVLIMGRELMLPTKYQINLVKGDVVYYGTSLDLNADKIGLASGEFGTLRGAVTENFKKINPESFQIKVVGGLTYMSTAFVNKCGSTIYFSLIHDEKQFVYHSDVVPDVLLRYLKLDQK